ncbi:MAG: PDZ domain-containing protein [Candidatus Cloacimonetes bacterium]|nr:PDZ domain-containing protein [Candidatus Cloacimonadota bacterium]
MKKILVILLISIMLISIPLFAKSKVRMGVVLGEKSKEQYGVLIKRVTEESPAEKAGLMTGDLLMMIGGDKIYTIDQVKKMLTFFEPEQKIKITFKRGDNTDTCILELEERKVPEIPKRTYMGVFLMDIDDKTKKKLKLKESFGILISEVVKDSPADEAGLKDKDVLLTFAGEKIYTTDQLIKMLKNFKPEDKVALEVIRGKKTKKLKLILGEKEDKLNYFFSGKDGSFDVFNTPENVLFYQYDLPGHNKWIGVQLDLKKQKTIKDGEETITRETTITKVIEGTPAEKAGLKDGDIIIAVEKDKDMEIGKAIKGKNIGDEVTLTIERDGKNQDIVVTIGERESLKSEKNVEVTIEDGEIKVIIDGVERNIGDLENIYEKLDEIQLIKHIKMEELDDVRENLHKVKEEMKNIDINIGIINTNDEL